MLNPAMHLLNPTMHHQLKITIIIIIHHFVCKPLLPMIGDAGIHSGMTNFSFLAVQSRLRPPFTGVSSVMANAFSLEKPQNYCDHGSVYEMIT
jgi:hypothetical protein